MWGEVGVATVIPDNAGKCSDCCTFRRSYPSSPAANMCTAMAKEATLATWDEEQQFGVSKSYGAPSATGLLDAHHTPSAKTSSTQKGSRVTTLEGSNGSSGRGSGGAVETACSSRDEPCVYNVVNDVAESVNLYGNPKYAATVAHLLQRVDYHLSRYSNFSIDHSNHTAAVYCDAVKAQNWVQPFEHFVPPPQPPQPPQPPSPPHPHPHPHPSPPAPPAPPTPPQPVPGTPQAELVGDWVASNGERYTIEIDPMHSGNLVYALFVKTGPSLTLCWSPMLPGTSHMGDDNGNMNLTVAGPAKKCSGGARNMNGALVWDPPESSNGGHAYNSRPVGSPRTAPRITWTDANTGKPGWKPWSKII